MKKIVSARLAGNKNLLMGILIEPFLQFGWEVGPVPRKAFVKFLIEKMEFFDKGRANTRALH
jgi:hypothetical protein